MYLPPFPRADLESPTTPPDFLQNWPVVSVDYKWRYPSHSNGASTARPWPGPHQEINYVYSWILENLRPRRGTAKQIYIHGSYLGATLGMSLALERCRPKSRFAIQGVVAYNGIYNWTMFLPEHWVNWPDGPKSNWPPAETSIMHELHHALPHLFSNPEALFDSMASPSLRFHAPGFNVPPGFYVSSKVAAQSDTFSHHERNQRVNRYMVVRPTLNMCRPVTSTAHVPKTLLLYDSPVQASRWEWYQRQRGNGFSQQSKELERLLKRNMLKTVQKLKLVDAKLNPVEDGFPLAIMRRIKGFPVGQGKEAISLGKDGTDRVSKWLRDWRI